MKLKFLSVSLTCLLVFMTLGCSRSRDCITKPPAETNLLIDASFEENGSPSLAGWTPDDTTRYVRFSQDVPPDGGNWSLAIEPGWAPGFYLVYKIVPAFQGTNRYQLSFWAKTTDSPGFAHLKFNHADSSVVRRFISITETAWLMYSVIDTIAANADDSILVSLSGGYAELSIGPAYFDLVKLEKLE